MVSLKKYLFIMVLFVQAVLQGAAKNPHIMPLVHVPESEFMNDCDAFIKACMQNNTEEAILLFHKNKNFCLEIEGKRLLQSVALFGSVDLATRTNGLMYAVHHENIDLVRFILENRSALLNGYDIINYQNHSGSTALQIAAHKKNVALVQLLLKEGANPSQVDLMSMTALHGAAFENQGEIITLLLNAGIDQTIRDSVKKMTAQEVAGAYRR
jgi:ankyrin repeat protein